MQAYPTRGSRLPYHGTSCSATVSLGDIVVGQLSREGNTAITRNLLPFGHLNVRQVAMIN